MFRGPVGSVSQPFRVSHDQFRRLRSLIEYVFSVES
ncbi:MAG: hypothetical protein ACI92S_002937 [Planctomycetaceae bacterium]|jgi:hypothetical protein